MTRLLDEVLGTDRAKVAFDLLTSSGLERYVQRAQSAAPTQKLRQLLRILPDMEGELIARSRDLVRRVLASRQRSDAEVDLAVLLATLATTMSRHVDQLLAEVGLLDMPSAAWAAGLARRLRHARLSTLASQQGSRLSTKQVSAVNDPWEPIVADETSGPSVCNNTAA